MRRLTGAAFVSLDGVIQSPGGEREDTTGGFDAGGWVFRLWDEEVEATVGELFTPPYALLLGRRTYDIFAAHWPYVEGEEAGMGRALTAADKHVVTHGDAPLAWDNSHRLRGIDDVAALKAGEGPDLLIQGSSTLYPQLIAAGLIDRLVLMIFPLVLGHGKRLFDGAMPPTALTLEDRTVTAKGTIIATYAPRAMPAMPADAPPMTSSAREEERQRRMQAGDW